MLSERCFACQRRWYNPRIMRTSIVFLGVLMLMATTSHAALLCSATLDAQARTLTVRPPAGYHFNLQAPPPALNGGALAPAKLTAAEAVVPLPAGITRVDARWFICDDGGGMCMVVREELVVDGARVTTRPAAAPAGHAGGSAAPPAPGAEEHGFLVDRPDEALERAKKERRPLIVDFFGIWCPPCNVLDETVFSRPEFARAAEAFIKLKLDADRDTSWALKERWRVGGYPTVVFATADGEEIDRIVGSRSLPEFLARVDDALAHQAQPRAVLEQRVHAGDLDAARRLSRMQLERQEYAPVLRRLERLKREGKLAAEDGILLSRARVGAAKAQMTEPGAGAPARAAYVEALKQALTDEPASADVLDWASTLPDLLEEDGDAAGATAAWTALRDATHSLEKRPDLLAREGLTRADLLQARASALDALKDADGTRKAYAEAAAEYAREIAEAGLAPASARGFNIERAFCLGKSGQVEQALQLYTALEKSYPGEFTFAFAHAGLLHSQKRAAEAEPLARDALQHAYGDNRLRAAERLAKLLKEQGKAAEAAAVVADALAQAKKPTDPFNRTHRYIAALEKLR